MVAYTSEGDSSTSPFPKFSHLSQSPPLPPLSMRDPKCEDKCLDTQMIDVCFVGREIRGVGIHEMLKGGVIKGEGFIGLSVVQIIVYMGIWRGWLTGGSVSRLLVRWRVSVMGIDSPFGWRCGSSSGIVLLEFLYGHITQQFVNIGRWVDGSRRHSGVGCPGDGCPTRSGRKTFPRGKGVDMRGLIEVNSMNPVEFLSKDVNSTIGCA